MTYVRTKTSIKRVGIVANTSYYVYSKNGISEYAINKSKILRIADTIEELCDEFVWSEITFDKGKDYNGNTCLTNQDRERDKHKITQEMIRDGIYGAIWCEWGLKYVAKMKGILPNGEIDWELL